MAPIAFANKLAANLQEENIYTVAKSEHQPLVSNYIETFTPILSEIDEVRYQKIFELQKLGKLTAAKKIIRQLDNDILMGHVLAQKYLHPTAHRSTFNELTVWLNLYADHPDARRLYRLALKRRPKGKDFPNSPLTGVRS